MLSPDEFRDRVRSASLSELQTIQRVQFKTKWKIPMKQIRVPKKYAFALRELALELYEADLADLEAARKEHISSKKPL